MFVVPILSSNHVSSQTNPQTCKMVTTVANGTFLINFLRTTSTVSVPQTPSKVCLNGWKGSHWLQQLWVRAPGQQAGQWLHLFWKFHPWAQRLLEKSHSSAWNSSQCCGLFQCLLQPVTFWYINNYPLDSGDIAFPASLPLPLSSCPALVYRPSVASGVKNASVPRAEVETGKHTKLNRIAKPSILCLCSNMCCYTGILKSPLHSTWWTSLLMMEVIWIMICCRAQRNHLSYKSVSFYNLYFLMMVHLFFSLHFNKHPGRW